MLKNNEERKEHLQTIKNKKTEIDGLKKIISKKDRELNALNNHTTNLNKLISETKIEIDNLRVNIARREIQKNKSIATIPSKGWLTSIFKSNS